MPTQMVQSPKQSSRERALKWGLGILMLAMIVVSATQLDNILPYVITVLNWAHSNFRRVLRAFGPPLSGVTENPPMTSITSSSIDPHRSPLWGMSGCRYIRADVFILTIISKKGNQTIDVPPPPP